MLEICSLYSDYEKYRPTTLIISLSFVASSAKSFMSWVPILFNYLITPFMFWFLGTGSKQIVEESQKYFVFLPVSHRIDIRILLVFLIVLVHLKTVCAMCFTIKHEDT